MSCKVCNGTGRFLQSEVAPVRHLLLKHAREAFVDRRTIEEHWQGLRYLGPPELEPAVAEYDRFSAQLAGFGAKLTFLPAASGTGMDSLYVRDASLVCEKGVILGSMGKPQRAAEPAAQAAAFEALGIPIHGAITGEGRFEGGDAAWIDDRTLAVARSYRTNDEGIRQLGVLLQGLIDELLVVPLPHWQGPGDVFHLMSILSPIDRDLALVYSPLMPIPFREALLARGFQLIEVPQEEFASMGCNVLAMAPRRCILLQGNPRTRDRLVRAGAEVHEFQGAEICIKGGGGPTCLTRPLIRG